MALEIVPFFLKHNAEADACDLLLELEMIHRLAEFVDKDTYQRVCLYILRYFTPWFVIWLLTHCFAQLRAICYAS